MRPLPALLKHIGRGARLAKDLDAEEAEALMRAVASGEADAYQIGGFLYAMRMKGEAPAELAGFVRALRGFVDQPPPAGVGLDVDLHADGREGRPSLALAAACIAAACGARVLLRGWFANRFSRNDLGEVFARLGVRGGDLDAGVAVVDLERSAPRVAALLALRERLGVRSCVHSAVKLLDPAGCRRQMIGIFHSPYHAPVAGAAALLGAERAAVVQAAGGLPELAPDRPTRVSRVDGGVAPAAPEPLGGGGPALEPAESPAALAELLVAVVEGRGPPGATRAALLTAQLMLWTAGLPDDRAAEALQGGGAARVLARLRM
jgi:anthranilate phosphoribosyltransferase